MPTDSDAIAEFLRDGGRIRKMREAVPATEHEVLDYLASIGVKAKFTPGLAKSYLCKSKRYSWEGLVSLANDHRRSQQLSPFLVPVGRPLPE